MADGRNKLSTFMLSRHQLHASAVRFAAWPRSALVAGMDAVSR